MEPQTNTSVKDFIKRNFAVLLALLLPLALVIFVALSVYLPSSLLSTKYNFIYATCSNDINHYPYNCSGFLQQTYSVVNDRLVKTEVDLKQDLNKDGVPDFSEKYDPRIFLHNTDTNESREISFEDAQKYNLSKLLTSPDGVTVSNGYDYNSGGDFFIFDGGHSSYGYYLMKGKSKKKINLINSNDRYYYQDNFQFLGWVLPGRN